MKPILITGGGKRVGAVIAKDLATNGFQPIIHYHGSKTEAEDLAKELNTVAIGGDLSQPDQVSSIIDKARTEIGVPLQGLINNASIFEQDRPETADIDLLARHYQVNTIAPVLLAKAFADQATDGVDNVIVNILDQKLWNLHPDFFSYTLSKAALETATQLMARSFAPRIRVCGVAPGYNLPSPGQSEQDFHALADKGNALQKRLHPEKVAQAVRFCLECDAITGQTILAANGEHLVPTDRDVSFKPTSS